MDDQADNGTPTLTIAGSSCDLNDFRRDAQACLDELARSGQVGFLTVDGERKGVVMSSRAFNRMADQIEQAEITEGIRRGLADIAAGRVRPAEDVYYDLIAQFGLDPAIVYGPEADNE